MPNLKARMTVARKISDEAFDQLLETTLNNNEIPFEEATKILKAARKFAEASELFIIETFNSGSIQFREDLKKRILERYGL